jgi:capsular exopolysaccharide synthesis family protein
VTPHNAGFPDPASNQPPASRRPAPGTPVAGRIGPPTSGPRDPGSKPPALAATPDPARLVQAFKRRWVLALALGLTLAGLVGAAAFTALSPKSTASSSIRLNAQRQGPNNPGLDSRYDFDMLRRSHASRIRQPQLLKTVLNRDEIKRFNLEKKYGDASLWLLNELKIETFPDTEIITLSIQSNDPEEATAIVNTVAQVYMKEVVERDQAELAGKVADLERYYTQATNKLREKQNALRNQALEIKGLDSEQIKTQYLAMQQAQSTSRAQFFQVSFDHIKAMARLDSLKASESSLDKTTISEAQLNEAIESDPSLKLQIAQLERYQETIKGLKESLHNYWREPRFITFTHDAAALEKKIATKRVDLRKELDVKARQLARIDYDNRVKQLEAEMGPLANQRKALETEINKLQAEMDKITTTAPELENLKSEIGRDTVIAADFGKRLELLRYELLAKSRISIFDEGTLAPLERKKQIMGTGAGGFIALASVMLGVSIWEFRRRRVHSSDEVSVGLGIPVVGSVPASAYVEQMINAPAEEEDGDPLLTESIDAIRTQLLHASQGEPARVLMVTSAGAGEGKTTLASHLAASLSRAGRKTLLIDGDLRQPAVHQIFEAPLQPGLSEVMLGEVDTVDAILTTNVPDMMIMTAGQWDREVLQSLARGGVQGALERLKDEFDFIIVDSHPVLGANDSLLIGKHVDAVILSVLREVSETPKVYAAAQRLNGLGIRVLGAVVNATDPEDLFTVTPSSSMVAV